MEPKNARRLPRGLSCVAKILQLTGVGPAECMGLTNLESLHKVQAIHSIEMAMKLKKVVHKEVESRLGFYI
jgi:hypothetical protein